MKTLPPPPFSVRVQNKEEWDKIAPMLEAEGYKWLNGKKATKDCPAEMPCFIDVLSDWGIMWYDEPKPEYELFDPFRFHLTHPSDLIPAYQTSGSAGFDLMAAEDKWIKSGKQEAVKTGLYIHNMPSDQFLGIYSRSGLVLKHRISVANAPGVVDSDFPGEIIVILRNDGTDDFHVKRGERIAQGVFSKIERPASIPVLTTERIGGFGSTNEQTGPIVEGVSGANT